MRRGAVKRFTLPMRLAFRRSPLWRGLCLKRNNGAEENALRIRCGWPFGVARCDELGCEVERNAKGDLKLGF